MLFLIFFIYVYPSLLVHSVALDTSYHLNEDTSTMLYYKMSSLSSGNIISFSSMNRINTNYYTALQMQIISPSGLIINSTTIHPNSACPYFLFERHISLNRLPNETFQIDWMCANLPSFPAIESNMMAIYREDFSLVVSVIINQYSFDNPGDPIYNFLTTQSNIVFGGSSTCLGTTLVCYSYLNIYSGSNASLISNAYALHGYNISNPCITKQYANGDNIFEIWYELLSYSNTVAEIQNNSLYLSIFFESLTFEKKVMVTDKYSAYSNFDAVALTNQNILVVWSDLQTASCSFRLFNQSGDPITSEKSFYNTFGVIYKAIAMPAGNFAIIFGNTLFKIFDETGLELSFSELSTTAPNTVIPLQSGSFFLIFDSFGSNSRVGQFFNSQGEPIYCLASCPLPKIISGNQKSCSQFVQDCSNYTNNSCQSCISPKILTIGKIFCANPINNCLTYADNGKCITCSDNTRLTIGAIACADPVVNCSVYSDNLLCLSCFPPNLLIIAAGQSKCATPIENCLNYTVDGLCSICSSGYLLSNYKFHCISIYCAVFRTDDKCDSCTSPKIVTQGNIECADPIEKCANYSDDKKCLSCNNNTRLTQGKIACATPISNCLSYSDDAKCESCQASKLSFLSADKKTCSSLIPDCKNYSDNGLCNSCFFGSNLTDDKQQCMKQSVKSSDYEKTLSSKFSLNINNSTAQNYVLKNNQLNFEVSLNNNSNRTFTLDVPNLNFELYNDTQTFQIYVFDFSNFGKNKVRFSCNLYNYPSSYYSFRMLLSATSSSRILQENLQDLPSNFTFTYETKNPIFLGLSDEITAEIQKINTVIQQDLGAPSSITLTFILIMFGPIVLIFLLVFLWCWYSYRKKKKVYFNPPTEAVTPQISEPKIQNLKEGNLVIEDL